MGNTKTQLDMQLKHPVFCKLAKKLLKQGFKPLQQTTNGEKHPGVLCWTTKKIEWIPTEPTWGVGICSRADGIQAIDVDVEDKEMSEWVEGEIRKEVGSGEFYKRTAEVTIPRFLCMLIIKGLDRKIVSHKFEGAGQIEIFAGAKCQYLAAGSHPKGGEYQCEPALGTIEELPTVSKEFVKELLGKFNERCVKKGFRQVTKAAKEAPASNGKRGVEAPYGSAQAVFNRRVTIDDVHGMLEKGGWS